MHVRSDFCRPTCVGRITNSVSGQSQVAWREAWTISCTLRSIIDKFITYIRTFLFGSDSRRSRVQVRRDSESSLAVTLHLHRISRPCNHVFIRDTCWLWSCITDRFLRNRFLDWSLRPLSTASPKTTSGHPMRPECRQVSMGRRTSPKS